MYIDTVKCGILEVDGSGQVTSFLEKPSSETTQSRLALSEIVSHTRTCTHIHTFSLSQAAVSLFLPIFQRLSGGHHTFSHREKGYPLFVFDYSIATQYYNRQLHLLNVVYIYQVYPYTSCLCHYIIHVYPYPYTSDFL